MARPKLRSQLESEQLRIKRRRRTMACLRLSNRTARIDIAIARNCGVGATCVFPQNFGRQARIT
jgi:hypothetical protein